MLIRNVSQLAKKDVPVHVKAQHIIAITRDITSESLHEALESLRHLSSQITSATQKSAEDAKQNGHNAIQSSEQFVQEHTPGDHSYADALKN